MLNPEPASTDAIDAAAALWLARRDRGLTSVEQDEYLQWLQSDPRHTEAVTQHAAVLERMMQLYEWQPGHGTEPNPDLFLPRQSLWARAAHRPGWRTWSAGLAGAAAVVVGYFALSLRSDVVPVATSPKSYLHVNERIALPDGSRVEVKDGSRVVVQYSETERRVKLIGGEAYFTARKDQARPFIVEVGGIEVRAVGTAFNIRYGQDAVEVLVTDGVVKVATPEETLPSLTAGERAVLPLQPAQGPVPVVSAVTLDDINRELAWQAPRLQFEETPLADAVAEFNRLNLHQLIIADPALNALRIGGNFRPDNVEGFVRMLTSTLDLQAETQSDGRTVLRR